MLFIIQTSMNRKNKIMIKLGKVMASRKKALSHINNAIDKTHSIQNILEKKKPQHTPNLVSWLELPLKVKEARPKKTKSKSKPKKNYQKLYKKCRKQLKTCKSQPKVKVVKKNRTANPLGAWRTFLNQYRAENPGISYRQAQKQASVLYKQR